MLLPDIGVRRSAPRQSLWGNTRMTDEIIQEVWRAKDRLPKAFDYDLDALAAELQKRLKRRRPFFLTKMRSGFSTRTTRLTRTVS